MRGRNAPEDLTAILLIQRCLYCRQYFVARLLVNLGFLSHLVWYRVASGSGISGETSRIFFWNLTVGVVGRVGGGSSGRLLVAAATALGDVPLLSVVRTKALLAKVLLSL